MYTAACKITQPSPQRVPGDYKYEDYTATEL